MAKMTRNKEESREALFESIFDDATKPVFLLERKQLEEDARIIWRSEAFTTVHTGGLPGKKLHQNQAAAYESVGKILEANGLMKRYRGTAKDNMAVYAITGAIAARFINPCA